MNSCVRMVVIALVGIVSSGMYGFGQKTLFSMRSQAVNLPRQTAGTQRLFYGYMTDYTSATLSVAPSYQHSFRADDITCFLFGSNCLFFSGSQVAHRGPHDILADYFGLPSDFQSSVSFDPMITNFVMPFSLHIELNGWLPGVFIDVYFPLVQAKWDLKLLECVIDPGSTFTSYPAGYLSSSPITLRELTVGDQAPKNVSTVFEGRSTFGDMMAPMAYGKIFGRQYETRVTELRGAFGYTFLQGNRYHAALSLQVAAPSGTLRNSKFLFEPIVGNDHHWELGAGFSAHGDIWCDDSEEHALGIFLDGVVTHLFASTQKRSFDLVSSGTGSRYILLQSFASPSVGLNVGTAPQNEISANQYQGRLIPAINATTLDAKISVNVQADVALTLNYKRRGFECALGYDFWVRGVENLVSRECLSTLYGAKGDAQIYGFTNPTEAVVALSATQHKATLHEGQTTDAAATNFSSGLAYQNMNADNILAASDTVGAGLLQLTAADSARLGIVQEIVQTSSPAILVTNSSIDECSALLPRALSHTVFGYISYAVQDSSFAYVPFIGVGGWVEFADTNPCTNSALSQWGLWIKMGVDFGGISYQGGVTGNEPVGS